MFANRSYLIPGGDLCRLTTLNNTWILVHTSAPFSSSSSSSLLVVLKPKKNLLPWCSDSGYFQNRWFFLWIFNARKNLNIPAIYHYGLIRNLNRFFELCDFKRYYVSMLLLRLLKFFTKKLVLTMPPSNYSVTLCFATWTLGQSPTVRKPLKQYTTPWTTIKRLYHKER